MSAILNSSLELTDVLGRLTDKMRIVAPYDFCAFILYQEESGEMVVAAQRGYDHRVAGKSFPLGESIILKQMFERWKTSSSEPYDFPDLGRRGRDIELFPIKELQQPLQSLYCLPLVAREKFIGACILGSPPVQGLYPVPQGLYGHPHEPGFRGDRQRNAARPHTGPGPHGRADGPPEPSDLHG